MTKPSNPAFDKISPLRKTLGYDPTSSAPATLPSFKATVVHLGGVPAANAPSIPVGAGYAATVALESPPRATPTIGYAKTVAESASRGTIADAHIPGLSTTAGRSAVLPRVSDQGDGTWEVDRGPRYEALKPLGEGGMGEVELVQDRDIERKVAIKRLRPDMRNPSALLRFADEVRAVGQLEHPNIVPVHDVGLDGEGQHYLVMKFVQGETLEEVIEKLAARDPAHLGRFSHEHRARVFLSILQAIRYAHSRGIIHRDIKPANIMVGPHGEVTVMDWGLAKTIRKNARETSSDGKLAPETPRSQAVPRLLETQNGALLGTPLYMSPEQASGKIEELDERSDIYSLTVLLYELMTLEHPLAREGSLEGVLSAIKTREYTRTELVATALRVDAPCEYYHYMVRGLAVDPAHRYQSIEEMERVLEQILDGKPPINCHITLTKRVGGELLLWIDRHKVLFTLLFLAALAGIVWSAVNLARASLGP